MRHSMLRLLVPVLLAALVAGCAANASFRKAESAEVAGNWDEAVLRYLEALDNDPGNIKYRAALLRAKIKASQTHFEKGKQFEKANVLERALVEYQQAAQLDPTNQYAAAQLEHTRRGLTAQRENRPNDTIEKMKERTRGTRPQPPMLNPRSTTPISLEFPQPVSIFQIYRALAQAFGINVLFDPNLKDQEIAIDLKDVTAQAALETLMHAAGHFYKVIDEHTILIAADTPQNRRTYEDLVIQTFFLSNAEVKDMTTILRSLIDAKKIATNDQLNAIILRDTADKVKVAEKIIETNDKSKAEVVVDVELLQINTNRMTDLGLALSQYSIGQALDTGNATTTGTGSTATTTGGGLRVSDIPFLNQSNWILTVPNIVYNFAKTVGEAQLLAKPQLRITEGQKANLVIGDKIPIPLTTFNTSNTIGGTIVPITSFQYQDVGIKIEIEPRVHHNQEVTLKVKIEVSNLGSNVTFNGQTQPTISTRTFDTTIRLQDGETNLLAGLLRTDDTKTSTGIPGLSDLPLIGRLFSDKSHTSAHTDVILTLTPHIIRNAEITQEDLLPIWVGTEANVSFRGTSTRAESETEGPFEGNEGTPEEIQDAIRRRIQRLPRGLRNDEEGGGGAPQQPPPAGQAPPPGMNLTPATPPSDIFKPTVPATPTPPAPQKPPPPPSEGEPPAGGPQSSALRAPAPAPAAAPVAPAARSAMAPRLQEPGAGPRTAPVAVRAAYRQEDAAAAQGAAVRVWLLPRRLTVAAGDLFEVAVQVSADRPISHLPLTLVFDPSLLAVEAVAPGDFLGDSGKAEILADFSRPGEVVVGASRLGDQAGVTGAGNLVRVTFRALTAGSALVGFAGREALDNALRPVLPISVKPAHIEVQDGGGGNGGGGGHRQPAKPGAPPAATPPSSGPSGASSGASGPSGAGPSDG
ncbi:MAG TPA: cohesin domain-containing protein [Thermoanaerobaculia bacterium]|nr:cohesin domain-containing protein [Thermoanaerobaculia bacterium]